MPEKDLNIEQVPVQRNTTYVKAPAHELDLRERAKRNTAQEHEESMEQYRKLRTVDMPEWYYLWMRNMPDGILKDSWSKQFYNDIGKKRYDEAYNEYLEQYPTSKWLDAAWTPNHGAATAGDVGFSNYSFKPSNLNAEKAYEYAVEKSGYDPGNPNDVWRNVDEMRDANSLMASKLALELPLISATGAGVFGKLPRTIMNSAFAYDGYKGLTSPEGLAKTANFVKQGKYGRAALSGSWDLFNVFLMKPILRPVLNPLKGFSKNVLNTAKFNIWNRGTGFKMDYPWQNTTGTPISGLPTVFNPSNSAMSITRFQNPLNAIASGRTYQTPQTTIKSAFPQMAYTADFSGVENIDAANFGNEGTRPNLGLRKLFTEKRSRQLLNSVAEEEKRNTAALKYMGSNWNNLSPTNQYWLRVNYGDKWNDKLIVPRLGTEGLLSLNEDLPRESTPMWKRIGSIIRKAQSDLDAMNSYHIQNVEEWNKLNGKNFKPTTFRTDVGMSKILSKKDFTNWIKQRKTNSPSNDVERVGAMYSPYEDVVYLRDDGISSGAYHEFLHQGQYGMRNPQVTLWRIGQLVDPKKIESLNPRQAAYYLSEQELPVYLRQMGENANINVGDPYPGDAEFDKLLTEYPIFGSATFLKRDTPEEKRLFWRALNGTLFGGLGAAAISKEKKGGTIK